MKLRKTENAKSMKIVSKPVSMIAIFRPGKEPQPHKFVYNSKEILVDRILSIAKTKIAGIEAYVYDCQSAVDGNIIRYELRYTIATCRWVLYKI